MSFDELSDIEIGALVAYCNGFTGDNTIYGWFLRDRDGNIVSDRHCWDPVNHAIQAWDIITQSRINLNFRFMAGKCAASCEFNDKVAWIVNSSGLRAAMLSFVVSRGVTSDNCREIIRRAKSQGLMK